MKPTIMSSSAALAALAALILSWGLAVPSLAGTSTVFSSDFDNGNSGAVAATSDLGTPSTGTWSYMDAVHGGVSSAADKAAAFVGNQVNVTGMTLMPLNGVAMGSTYPVTRAVEAGGSKPSALIANFAHPGAFTGGSSTTISFDWGMFGLSNTGAFKYAFVRGLDASGNEVFELLFTHSNPVTTAQIIARGPTDSQTSLTAANAGTPQGTVLITGFPDATQSSTTVANKPSGLIGVTITLANGQVTYAFSKGTASGSGLTYAVNSAAATIARLEFSETWNSTLGDLGASNNKGYWLDNLLASTTPTYTLTYNGNANDGGTVPVDANSPYNSGNTVTLTGNTGSLVKSGLIFNGWNTAANGSGTAYSPTNTFAITVDTTLFAQWVGVSATISAPATFPSAVSTSYGTPSTPTSVAVSGSGLTTNITATAPSGFEVSSNGTTYNPAATFTQSGGNASGTLYLRLAANSPVLGSYDSKNVALKSTGAIPVNVATAASGNTVSPKTLTIPGATARNKIFDGTTAGAVTGNLQVAEAFGAGNSGDGKPYIGDTVSASAPGTFASSAVGTGISVSPGTFVLAGTSASNYSITQPTLPTLTASILDTAIWTNPSGGAWSTAGNWQNNIIADNAGNTADFNQVDIPADTTVSLTTARTLGKLIFGDTDSLTTPASWTLANDAVPANTLTLDGITPTVTVNTLGSGANVTISAVIAGTSGLTKAGPGTLKVSAANTYTGGTTIASGTLQAGSTNTLGAGDVNVLSGSTLDLNGFGQTNNAIVLHLAGTGVGGIGALANNSGSQLNFGLTNLVLDADASIGGTVRYDMRPVTSPASTPLINLGGRVLTKVGPNQVWFQQASSISDGDIIVQEGVLGLNAMPLTGNGLVTIKNGAELRTFRNNSAQPSTITRDVAMEGGATLSYTGTNTADAVDQSIGSIIDLAGNPIISVTNAGAVLELTEAVTGPGGISKMGAGTLALSGINGYSGSTDVTDGVVVLNGTHTGGAAYSVSAAATLGGTGSTSSAVTVTGTLAPGNGIGTLSIGNLDLEMESTIAIEINTSTASADKIVVMGNVTRSGGVANLILTDVGSDVALPNGTKLVLDDYSGTWDVSKVLTYAGNPVANGSSINLGANTFTVKYNDGSAMTLTVGSSANYASWAAAFTSPALSNTAASADPDNDGLSNIVEYALGLDPRFSSGSPGVSSNGGKTITFTKGAQAKVNLDVTYKIETSTTLGASPSPWTSGTSPVVTENANTVAITFPSGPTKNFARLKVSQVP